MAGLVNIDVGSVLSGIGSLAKDLRSAITGDISPEKKAEIETMLVQINAQLALAQMKINEVEAQSPDLFKSGWRPAVGWCGVLGLFWYSIGNPLLMWYAAYMKLSITVPVFDYEPLFALLFGILGLGGFRTYEKTRGK